MLSEDIKNQLKKEFEKLIEPVELVFHRDNSELSKEIEDLLREISSVSEKIYYRENSIIECYSYPCIAVKTIEKDFGIRFMGKPDGGEFDPFIKTILMVSRNDYDLTERTVELIEEIDKQVDIKIFITKGCGWCPPTMLKIFSFALVSDFITATAIDCYAFQELAIKYNVAAVPKVVINDRVEFIGLKEENEILGHIFGAVS
ncbi:Glutaredoxin-like domain protein [Persephonella hydrogeniphila]|uniref:Glutaredoxin-like domain protein n=1 Tax=Persephonella hydrogeniphila TaxID=198703 RepID=A0A285N9R7_9AQUI|nr:thioredoxin family protein [Persephonella hydrogeniphila]SNZ06232.1 Glutaredoxin-like domain protein [Persephonella hydrogeniphila]